MMRLYREAGYDAVVVTDHMFPSLPTLQAGETMEQKAEIWLSGYRAAREEGEALGLKVLLGAEMRLTSFGNEDFLTYGFAEEDVPALLALLDQEQSIQSLSAALRARGVYLVQAHPYRKGLRAQSPEILDAVEAYNGNPRHDSHNDQACALALQGGLALLSGSDAHQPVDVGRGGMIVPDWVTDEPALLRWLRENAPRTMEAFAQTAIQAENEEE